MQHIFEPVYSREELINICKNADLKAARGGSLNMGRYRKNFSEALVGKDFNCNFDDGMNIRVVFPDVHTLKWTEDSENWHEEYYEAMQSTAGNVIGAHFVRRHVLPFEGAFVVFDLDTGYVTWVTAHIGSEFDEKFASTFPHFGEIEGFGTHEGPHHHYSNDLVGVSIDWQYNEQFTIRHSYVSPTLTISPHLPGTDREDGDERFIGRGFLRAFNAKVRDNLLLTSFTEPGNCCAILLIDMNIVHDIGCFFGLSYQGTLDSETITALGGIGNNGLKASEGYAKPLVNEE